MPLRVRSRAFISRTVGNTAGCTRRFAGLSRLPVPMLVLLGYLSYISLGWALLKLPMAQEGAGCGSLDCLFTSASAISTTGLVTVSVADSFSRFGEVVVLMLIQLGGLGYMTLGSFVILARKPEIEGVRSAIARSVFTLPDSFELAGFLRGVIWFTLTIELCGALALYPLLSRAGVADPLWSAVFHSVSAFCTAGFSLSNSSFEGFADHFWVNAVIAVLSYLGAIGFIVCLDMGYMLSGRHERMTLTSRIILHVTLWLTVIGTALLFIAEPTLESMSPSSRLLAAFFQAMTAMTTVGFNTVPIGALSRASLLVLIVLMIIGASPSGTGGGLKSTTLTAVLGVMRSSLRGTHQVTFWGRVVPVERIWTATSALGFYLLVLLIGTYLLELTESAGFEALLFEAASALGTVGLSTGITPLLTPLGKITVILLMICGRVGPLGFGLALFSLRPQGDPARDSDLAV